MAGKPASHSKPWSAEEVSKLVRLGSEGTSIRAVAKELGRAPGGRARQGNGRKGVPQGPVRSLILPPIMMCASWDEDAGVWSVSSDRVPGLQIETTTSTTFRTS